MVLSSFYLYANSLVFEKSNSEKLSKVTLNSPYIDFYSSFNSEAEIETHVSQFMLGPICFSQSSPFSLDLLPFGLAPTWVGQFQFNDNLRLYLTCPMKESDNNMVGGLKLNGKNEALDVFFYHTDPTVSSSFYLQRKKLTDLGRGAVLTYEKRSTYSSFHVEVAHNSNDVENIGLRTSFFYQAMSLSFSHESFLGEMTQELCVDTDHIKSNIIMKEYEESPFGGEGARREYECKFKTMKELGKFGKFYLELQRSARKKTSGDLIYHDAITTLVQFYPVKLIPCLIELPHNPKVSFSITFGPEEYRWKVKVGSISFLPKSYQVKGGDSSFSFSIGSDARCNYTYTITY